MADPTAKIQRILEPGEQVLTAVTQQAFLSQPITAVITNLRLVICRPKLFGTDFTHHDWVAVGNVEFVEGAMSSSVTVDLLDGAKIILGNLPKQHAPTFFALAQSQARLGFTERRRMELEDKRAASGGTDIDLGGRLGSHESSDEIIGKINQLKTLKDQGVITDTEFQAKKAELLNRL